MKNSFLDDSKDFNTVLTRSTIYQKTKFENTNPRLSNFDKLAKCSFLSRERTLISEKHSEQNSDFKNRKSSEKSSEMFLNLRKLSIKLNFENKFSVFSNSKNNNRQNQVVLNDFLKQSYYESKSLSEKDICLQKLIFANDFSLKDGTAYCFLTKGNNSSKIKEVYKSALAPLPL